MSWVTAQRGPVRVPPRQSRPGFGNMAAARNEADPSMPSADDGISFGPFRLFPARQLLLEADKPVRLGSRALDILVALVERRGDLVSKEELIARVWPDTFVEDGNLRVHMAALRRALGDGQAGTRFIATVPGRGYRFVSPTSIAHASGPTPPPAAATTEPAHNLPRPLTRLVGRADVVETLAAQLPLRRFITLVGPGGIGKTTVALAVAERVVGSYRDKAHFLDLAPLADPGLVPSALASALGMAVLSDNPIPELIAFLKAKHMLLVLDSCEHVIDAAAVLAQDLLKAAPGLHILATSREPLRAEGESVQRLPPLNLPPLAADLTAAEALGFPSVQLFVERAAASLEEFELSDANAPIVAEICRRLDGIALAIELAASRVDAFGVGGLAALLDDRFRLLMRGRRTSLPRHQTLAAALDWSYEALPEDERTVLRRLSVLVGDFTLEAANAIIAGDENASADVVGILADLVDKSLVSADVGGSVVDYRLLDTTRAYAREKLAASGEAERLARRHADYYRGLFERAEAEWETLPTVEWVGTYGRELDNVRAALDWTCSPGGDTTICVELTVAAVPLWFQLSLLEECRGRAEHALTRLGHETGRESRRHMQLLTALGIALLHTRGPGPEVHATWTRVLGIAERLGDADYQLRAFWGLWLYHVNCVEFRAAMTISERAYQLAARTADPVDLLIGERMVGNALYYLGDHQKARRHLEHMLENYRAPANRSPMIRFQYDQSIAGRMILARVLWELGFPDRALSMAERTVEDALALGHALSLCLPLAVGICPIALSTGDLAKADHAIALLKDHATRQGLAYWLAWGRGFEAVLQIKRGNAATGLPMLDAALDANNKTSFARRHIPFIGEFAEALGHAGQVARGLAAIDEAIATCERHDGRWCFAELLRVKGELILRAGAPASVAAAERHFLDSLDWARRQEARSWELRTMTSLARLRVEQGRPSEARDLLAPVYGRFTEGFGTADLRTAKALLDDLA
jgi:predicted ATPase/DNA-binding winged helix-turn-helix (wHTH) protein